MEDVNKRENVNLHPHSSHARGAPSLRSRPYHVALLELNSVDLNDTLWVVEPCSSGSSFRLCQQRLHEVTERTSLEGLVQLECEDGDVVIPSAPPMFPRQDVEDVEGKLALEAYPAYLVPLVSRVGKARVDLEAQARHILGTATSKRVHEDEVLVEEDGMPSDLAWMLVLSEHLPDLSKCRLTFSSQWNSHAWPVRWLETERRGGVICPDGIAVPALGAAPTSSSTVVNAAVLADELKDSLESWRAGNVDNDEMMALVQEHESTKSRSSWNYPVHPIVESMFAAVTPLIMTPAADGVMDQMEAYLTNEITSNVNGAIDIGINEEIIELSAPAIGRNVTNMAVDAITHFVTRKVSWLVAHRMGRQLRQEIVDAVVPSIREHVNASVVGEIASRVIRGVPMALRRSLPIYAAHHLTHTLSRTLTATLSHTMQDLRFVNYWCSMCAQERLWCDYCRMGNKNYFSSYYSTYYSDYFTNYYAAYYIPALIKVDQIQATGEAEGGE